MLVRRPIWIFDEWREIYNSQDLKHAYEIFSNHFWRMTRILQFYRKTHTLDFQQILVVRYKTPILHACEETHSNFWWITRYLQFYRKIHTSFPNSCLLFVSKYNFLKPTVSKDLPVFFRFGIFKESWLAIIDFYYSTNLKEKYTTPVNFQDLITKKQ